MLARLWNGRLPNSSRAYARDRRSAAQGCQPCTAQPGQENSPTWFLFGTSRAPPRIPLMLSIIAMGTAARSAAHQAVQTYDSHVRTAIILAFSAWLA